MNRLKYEPEDEPKEQHRRTLNKPIYPALMAFEEKYHKIFREYENEQNVFANRFLKKFGDEVETLQIYTSKPENFLQIESRDIPASIRGTDEYFLDDGTLDGRPMTAKLSTEGWERYKKKEHEYLHQTKKG